MHKTTIIFGLIGAAVGFSLKSVEGLIFGFLIGLIFGTMVHRAV